MSLCSRCGAQFDCAMAAADRIGPLPGNDKHEPCWCTLLPTIVALPSAPVSACWCRACLQQHIAASLLTDR